MNEKYVPMPNRDNGLLLDAGTNIASEVVPNYYIQGEENYENRY